MYLLVFYCILLRYLRPIPFYSFPLPSRTVPFRSIPFLHMGRLLQSQLMLLSMKFSTDLDVDGFAIWSLLSTPGFVFSFF